MNYFKLACGWVASWTLYWIGDAVSRLLNAVDVPCECEAEGVEESPLSRLERASLAAVSVLYPVYNWFMVASGDVQDWGGVGPWHACESACECDAYCSECEVEPPLDDVALEEDAGKKPSSDSESDSLGPAQMFTWLE